MRTNDNAAASVAQTGHPVADVGAAALGDNVSVLRWFGGFSVGLLAACAVLAWMISRQSWSWGDWWNSTAETFAMTSPAVKLLGFAVYMSLCTTFMPLPTGWIVAGVATREAAVGAGAADTVLLVALVGAAASTIANLNDYHLFTLMLRHRRVARLRETATYQKASRWFARSPAFLIAMFNIIPIPVDVVRMLATTYRYPRDRFAAANFAGRFIRYGVIAFVTYWWNLGYIAAVALLALAVVMGAIRLGPAALRRLMPAAVRSAPTREHEFHE